MEPSNPAFFKGIFWGFFTVTCTVLLLVHALVLTFPESRSTESSQVDRSLLDSIPVETRRLAPDRNAGEAKKRQRFWASRTGTAEGIALPLLQDPLLFSGLFPGYPDSMRRDEEIWRKYFAQEFNPTGWSEKIKKQLGVAVQIHYSWSGCLEVWRKYGADIVVFGSSETYRAIIPDLLSRLIAEATGGVAPRVLMCGTSGMPITSVLATLRWMDQHSAGSRKIPWIVWGVSFWSLHDQSDWHQMTATEKSRELRSLDASPLEELFSRFHRVKLGSILDLVNPSVAEWNLDSPLSWSNIFPLSAKTLREIAQAKAPATARTPAPPGVAPSSGIWVPAALSTDAGSLEAALRRANPGFGANDILKGISQQNCRFSSGVAALREAAFMIGRLSERALLFIPPTTSYHIDSAPECLVSEARRALRSLTSPPENPGLRVLTDRLEAYSLDARHFLLEKYTGRLGSGPADFLFLDMNHMNFQGAERFTREISHALLHP